MKINLGCGKDYREGYINIDYVPFGSDGSDIKVDLFHNIKSGLPFEDNIIEEIICHEFLEHQSRFDSLFTMQECYRVLKSGGLLDVTVPPVERQLKIFLLKVNEQVTMDDFFNPHNNWKFFKFHEDFAGAVNERTYKNGKDWGDGGSHKTFFTVNSIKCMLEYCGFKIGTIDNNIWVKAYK